MEWIQDPINIAMILGVIGGLHALAKPIIKWTSTKADDKALALFEKLMRIIGLQPKD